MVSRVDNYECTVTLGDPDASGRGICKLATDLDGQRVVVKLYDLTDPATVHAKRTAFQ